MIPPFIYGFAMGYANSVNGQREYLTARRGPSFPNVYTHVISLDYVIVSETQIIKKVKAHPVLAFFQEVSKIRQESQSV